MKKSTIIWTIVTVIGIALIVGLPLYNKHKNTTAIAQLNASTSVNVGNEFTVTLPCKAKVNQITGDASEYASCTTESGDLVPQYDYWAWSNTGGDNCTNTAPFTDNGNGKTSQYVNANMQTINGVPFDICGEEQNGNLVEVLAFATNNNSVYAEVTVSPEATSDPTSQLWSKLNNVLGTFQFE